MATSNRLRVQAVTAADADFDPSRVVASAAAAYTLAEADVRRHAVLGAETSAVFDLIPRAEAADAALFVAYGDVSIQIFSVANPAVPEFAFRFFTATATAPGWIGWSKSETRALGLNSDRKYRYRIINNNGSGGPTVVVEVYGAGGNT